MITIISATNRPDCNTLKVAKNYASLMEKHGVHPLLLSLETLPMEIYSPEIYTKKPESFEKILNEFIIPAQKFVFISPEYNGSFPGILKVFLDAMPYNLNRNKKAALIGVSTGRAGNLRGMDHLSSVLNFCGLFVHPMQIPISSVLQQMDESGALTDANTLKVLNRQIEEFSKW